MRPRYLCSKCCEHESQKFRCGDPYTPPARAVVVSDTVTFRDNYGTASGSLTRTILVTSAEAKNYCEICGSRLVKKRCK